MAHDISNNDAVILSAVRTPIVRFQGQLASFQAAELGALAIRSAIEMAGIPREFNVDKVFMGMDVSTGAGQVPAR